VFCLFVYNEKKRSTQNMQGEMKYVVSLVFIYIYHFWNNIKMVVDLPSKWLSMLIFWSE
jgi:hypothetical protein